eukprot:Hpha_TRINITY_DN14101_c0_g2::TRINITY_DN14101_c0_g2_i1::g.10583::m.10583/K00993/EPT1; ethanolaminephosphotransferase
MSSEAEVEEQLSRPYFWCWITQRGREKLPQYKYKGSDSSLIYQNIFSPTLNKIVEAGYVPRWLHPNVITLSGFGLVVFSYLLIAAHSEDFSKPVPAWVCIVSAICLHTYQWLDALDGKQARHLKIGSPLGLLCDHGCDSINASITAINIVSVLQFNATWQAYLMWMMTTSAFFFNTWEEWFVGSLDLPLINGPNEGLIVVCIMFLWTAAMGPEWWNGPAVFDLDRREFALAAYSGMSICTVLGNVVKTLNAVYVIRTGSKDSTAVQRQAATRGIALTRTIPFVVMVCTGLLWVLYSPTNVFARHPRVMLLSLGMLCSKCCAGLMVSHLCDEPYRPFCKTIAAVAALGCYEIITYSISGTLGNEDSLVITLAALAVFCIAHAVVGLTKEISTILGINVLIVPGHVRHPSTGRKVE